MTTLRNVLQVGLVLGAMVPGTGLAASVQMLAEGDDGARVRVETTETRDAAGRRYEVETRTDLNGWRTRAVKATDLAANANATTLGDLNVETDSAIPAVAGWRSIGPDGGDIRRVAVSPINPQVILAGLVDAEYSNRYPALYRSTDGGANWHVVLQVDRIPEPFFVALGVYGLEFGADGVAYAATTNGLWKSSDAGETWSAVTARTMDVRSISIESRNSDLWIGLETGAIYRSSNGGATWDLVGPPRDDLECRGIAFDAARPGVVFACFGYDYAYPNRSGAVWMSSNNGVSWVDRTNDLPNDQVNDIVFRDGRLYVGAGNDYVYPQAGVYVSTDDGHRWSGLNAHWPFQSRTVRDIEFDPVQPCVMWVATPAGIFRSNDCGTSFSFFIGHSRQSVSAIRLVPGSDVVLAGSDFGFLRREGLGDFQLTGRGIRDLSTSVVAQNPLDSREIAVACARNNSGGVYTTLDGGEHWTLENTLRARVTNVAFDREGALYAVSDGPTTINQDGVYRRETNGTWTYLGPDEGVFAETALQWMQISRTDPRVILVGGADYTNNGFALAVWRTTDRGLHWQKVLRRDAVYSYSIGDGLLLEDGANRTMLASLPVDPDGALWRSTDGGDTWARVAGGLPPYAPHCLAARPSDPNRVVLALGWLYESLDAGVTWNTITTNPAPAVLRCDPNDPRVLYGVQTNFPPYGTPVRSTDGGRTMQPFDQSLNAVGRSLAVGVGECPELLLSSSTGVWARSVGPPPSISARTNVTTLWPPNHQMVDVHFDVSVTDACDPSPRFVLASIACDEPGSAGDIEGASLGTPDTDFRLRATRSGNDVSRLYTITYRALNASGDATDVVRVIEVPHDQSAAQAAGGEPTIGSTASAPPTVTALTGVSPSPFAARTTVSFDLAAERAVRVRVLDVRGAVVRTLADGVRPAGRYRLDWDGRDGSGHALANGVYWVSFEGPARPQGRRIVLIH